MTPLETYIRNTGISRRELTKRINRSRRARRQAPVTEQWVGQIVGKAETPSADLALVIAEVTGLPVTDILFPRLPGPQREAVRNGHPIKTNGDEPQRANPQSGIVPPDSGPSRLNNGAS